METYIVVLILLVIIAALFSGAEIAFTSLSPAKTKTLEDAAHLGYRLVYKLKQQPENLLITILIGNNLSSILAAALATYWTSKVFGGHAIGLVSGVLTFVILIFGEIVPKTLAQKYAMPFSFIMAFPLFCLVYLLRPILWLIRKFITGLMILFNAKNPIKTMSEDELLALVDIGTKEGVIEEQEQELIENVMDFTEKRVDEVMTLKKDIEALVSNTTIHDAAKFLVLHTHSRIPVYEDSLNNIIGIFTVHDILRLSHNPGDKVYLKDLHYKPLIVVPCTQLIKTLFSQFQKQHQHLAIVINEHGETIGLVTLEDILEEIVGEIVDEQDLETQQIIKTGGNQWTVLGDTTIEEINDGLALELTFPEHQTIGLLILEQLKALPYQGQKIQYENLSITVKKISNNKIDQVIISVT